MKENIVGERAAHSSSPRLRVEFLSTTSMYQTKEEWVGLALFRGAAGHCEFLCQPGL